MEQKAIQIPLYGRGSQVVGYATVDESDAPLVMGFRWRLQRVGSPTQLQYAVHHTTHRRQNHGLLMHRLILGIHGEGRRVSTDHINHDGLDNRRCNLRRVTPAQNQQNKRANATGSSRYRGVRRHRQRWQAFANAHGTYHHLGTFDNEIDAARAASEWRRVHMPYSTDALARSI